MITEKRKTAGELSHIAMSDQTKYDALEIGHDLANDIAKHLRDCIENHRNIIDENEFCIVMILAKDPLIHNLLRRKFYAWPYLPKPRPNQAVFLYNKAQDRITKRLWVLPCDMVMAELHSLSVVDKRYESLKRWSDAFYKGWKFVNKQFINTDPFFFWEYVRADQNTNMLSEHEYFLKHREELMQAGCQNPDLTSVEPFDFSKIQIKQIVDTKTSAA
jgi:hypothetical protein